MYDKCSDCEYGDVENLRLENQELKKQYEEYIRAEIKLKDELEKQREVIDKAIKYIDDNSWYYNDEDSGAMFCLEEEKAETFCNDLLKILKEVE